MGTENRITPAIAAGRILIKEQTPFPEGFFPQSVPCGPRWRMITDLDGYALGRTMMTMNWMLFSMLDEIHSIAFGIDREKSIGAAVNRILAKLDRLKFNAAEIAEVTSKRFLGLRFSRVSVRSKHIQQSAYIFHAALP